LHQVTVTDVNTGCTDIASVNILEPSLLVAIIDSVDTNTCLGATEGVAYASATGGTGTYTYAWPNGDISAAADTLAAGSYTVTITDANGCSATATAIITEPATGLSVVASTDSNATCFGLSNGGVTAIASGGSGTYTYEWPGSLFGATQTGLSAGTYIVTVSDGGTCTAVDTAMITEPSQLTGNTVSSTTPSCPGSSDATAEVVGVDGTPGYSYEWPSGTIGTIETGLSDGTYDVTITDNNGCEFVHAVIITDPAGMGLTQGTVSNTGCGVCNGSATVVIGGTSPSYTFVWSPNGETSNPAVALCAGANEVFVTDANGCVDSLTFNINSDGADTVIASSINTLCFGDSTGTAISTYNCVGGGCSVSWFDIPAGNLITTGDTAFNLPSGQFVAQLTNGSGCVSFDTATIDSPTPLVGNIDNFTNVNCFNGFDGTATADATGGTGPYTYVWDNGDIGTLADSLIAGTHCFTVTDANGCVDTACVTLTQPATGLSVSASLVQDVSCNGGSDGEIAAVAAGGSGTYTYLWNGTLLGASQTGLSANTYIVVASDGGVCIALDTVIVAEPTPIVITLDSSANPSCPGSADGFAGVTASGGTGPYTYAWPSGNVGQVETGLADGTYTVVVTDANLCSDSLDVLIVDPLGMALDSFSGITDSDCAICDGTATAVISGGTMPYTYSWNNGQIAAANDSLCAGFNSVTITDAGGCSIVENVGINGDGADTVIADGINATCGSCDGVAFATYNCNNGPCQVTWTDFNTGAFIANTDTIDSLCAGIYAVQLTNGLGCISVDTVHINTPTLINPGMASTDASCFGVCDGTITLSPTGGSGVFTFTWDNGAGNVSSQIGLCAGVYNVTIADAGGCDTTIAITIDEPSQILANETIVNASCGGVCDGSITTSPTPNSGSFSYNWSPVPSNGNGAPLATGLCAGTYFLTITEAGGCSIIDTFVVTEPTPITLDSSNVINASCGDTNGIAFVQAIGGDGIFTYAWSNGDVGQTADSLMLGLYDVTVTDASGCSASFPLPVSESNGPTINITSTNVSASGLTDGTATANIITAQGSVSYLWSNLDTNQTADTLAAGFYSVTVTDSAGCSTVDTVTISEPTLITVSFAITEITCGGGGCDGAITASVTGGVMPYTYLWSTGDTTITIDTLCAATYTLTVTDANGVVLIDSVQLNDPTPFTFSPTIVDASCNGVCDGSINLAVTGGSGAYSYLWNTGDTTSNLSGLCAGQYSVIVSDTTGCSDSLTIDVNEPGAIVVSVDNIVEPNCPATTPDGSIEVSATGGNGGPFSYQWYDAQFNVIVGQDSSFASNLTAGIYNVAVVDQSTGCSDTSFVILNNNGAPNITLDSIVPTSCFGTCDGAIFTTITGGIGTNTIIWSSGGTNDDEFGICAGNDTIAIVDGAFCLSTSIFEVTSPEEITIEQLDVVSVTCGNNCDGEIEVAMQGGTAPYNFTWSTGATVDSIGGLCSGTYSLTVTDSKGCTFTTDVNVGGPVPMVIALDSINDATCSNTGDGAVFVTASGGVAPYLYSWADTSGNVLTSQDLTNVQAGQYILTLEDAIGCTMSDTFTVGADFAISVIAPADTTVCPFTVDISVTGSFTGGGSTRWLASNGIILSDGVQAFVDATQDTNMFVYEGTNNLCVSRDTMYVYQSGGPGLDAGPDVVIEPGESVTIGGDPTSSAGSAVTWSPANDDISSLTATNPSVFPLQTTVFYVTATDVNGCFGLDSVIVTVENLVDPVGGFSPNGDGVNDLFFIDRISNYPNAVVQIFNRWGNPIFTSNPGYTTPWNGRFNGNDLPHGTYYFVIDLKDAAVPAPITGPVTILK
jgi:gliding motility-associated-like protein